MQNEKKATVKKRKRKKHPMKILISLLAIGVSCFLIYAASKDVIVMLNLKRNRYLSFPVAAVRILMINSSAYSDQGSAEFYYV